MHPHEATTAPLLSIPIDLTWTSSLMMLLAVYESGNTKGRSQAKQHLQRMAELADLAFDAVKTIERMVTEEHVRDDDLLQVVAEARRLSATCPLGNTLGHASASRPTGDGVVLCGKLAKQISDQDLPLEVCYNAIGFYIGTFCNAQPYTRESEEHWPQRDLAAAALKSGEWTQRTAP